MKNIKHYLDILDKHRDEMAMAFMSDPGLSKTSQCKEWCKEHGRNYFEFITSQRMPSEISGMAMPDNDEKRMKIYDFDYLLDMKDGDMLAFDEFTNGNIMTLNACLTLIQERSMLSGRKLPSILVVAMGNHQGQCDLLPQTKQRFIWIDVKYDADFWADWANRHLDVNVTSKLKQMIAEQYSSSFSHSQYNYLTCRSVTNLLKLAKEVPEDDQLWKRMPNITVGVIRELYASLNMSDREKQKRELMQKATSIVENIWSCGYEDKRNDIWKASLMDALNGASTMKDLREVVTNASAGLYGDVGLDFVRILKTKDMRDPWEKNRDSISTKIESLRNPKNHTILKNAIDVAVVQLAEAKNQQDVDNVVDKIITGKFGASLKTELEKWEHQQTGEPVC